MNQASDQVALENIRSIREQLKREVPGVRAYHSREERAMKFLITELAAVIEANETACGVLAQLSSGLDPFSAEFDQATVATAMLKTAMDRAGKTLKALGQQYHIPKQGAL